MRMLVLAMLSAWCFLLSAQTQWSAVRPLDPNPAATNGADNQPYVASGGNGTWIAVWVSEENIAGALGSDGDIFFARSTDNGQSWSAPQPLNDAANDSFNDTHVQVQTDGNGRWIAAWSTFTGTDFDILYVRSTDDGQTWSMPAFLNDDAAADTSNEFNPTLETDGQGNWLAAWSTVIVGVVDNDIMVARSSDDGASWAPAMVLNSNAGGDGNDFVPDLATDGQGNWVAVWHSNDNLGDSVGDDDDIFVSRSANNGMTWSTVDVLNDFAASDGLIVDTNPSIACDGQGNWITVWSSAFDLGDNTNDFDVMFSRSSDLGETWSSAATINGVGDLMDDFLPRIASDQVGGWLVVWGATQDGGATGTDGDIFAAFSNDVGTQWAPTVAIDSAATSDEVEDANPDVAYDAGSGRWLSVWRGAANDDLEIVYAFSPPPCELSDNFSDSAATWPATNMIDLVEIVNRDCE